MIYKVNNELRCSMLYDGTAEAILADIFQIMDCRTFPKRESESIVGGPGRLQRLVNEQKVRVECKNNGRSYYNASDVLRHALIKHKQPRKARKNEKNNSNRATA